MIVTVTLNPSLDRTVTLTAPLTRGAVQRVDSVTVEAGGKGINVAKALTSAGVDALALLPAATDDPLLTALRCADVPFTAVPIAEPVRTNIAITENDGTTTKLNERGATLDAAALDAITRCVVDEAQHAAWVVLSGSLPPGVPPQWYADVVAKLAPLPCRVAVDTSDAPLAALASKLSTASPELMKPNVEELASISGVAEADLETTVAEGDLSLVVAAAVKLVERGVGAVLATLGAAGAVLVDGTGAWFAAPPPITARSTVGAGDASLAGYLRAEVGGAEPSQRLRMAVAYGGAAAALPGSALPVPAQLDLDAVRVTDLITTNREVLQ
ncbi:1-phosphofructokinase family hexose kinase [Mycolicibacterium smegmatis]|uniref:1-phosphofructokinase family hexose kinase n=1 Tax=Mycolicibacterium smegmatis TaxID=1772 RepID=UPI0005D9218D|nr:1-phosphofructokinase family hexose kinase [Mycolicibacterium smegmatis]MDF1902897.1 1-phosphofructokinase family hexose kinase [Mycolicibacterium smegmatis]MDF1909447.1 1-phosphofructokinase family hexose kinase [Mycolicibacterium smegmatis]MDF1921563.1 1-phosphofructokinase family hexose kinase [Mycolicibacterium smegmatis]MDF1927695.1 1-phosphofructokinase family hexose kinase [Mycolicibacterium smegmatis]UAK52424.1 1-phosphofructokinase family hexose kinase [Mycolicibacterium smegmatis]